VVNQGLNTSSSVRPPKGAGRPSSSWRVEPPSPPATWTIEEYTIGDLVSVRPYRGSFEPVGVVHEVTSHIKPLAAQARPVRTRQHRIKHDTRMLDRPPRPVGAGRFVIRATQERGVGAPSSRSLATASHEVVKILRGAARARAHFHRRWTRGR
jgi:hypothetical protein